MIPRHPRWITVASGFPCTLDTETDPTKLGQKASPDAIGIGLDYPGFLYPATASAMTTGDTAIKQTYVQATNTYTWYYRRCWRMNGTALMYNAPLYQTCTYEYAQDCGRIGFDDDSNVLITFFPFAGNQMFVAKSTGGYAIDNADSFAGRFQAGHIVPEMAVAVATSGVQVNDLAFVSNTLGVFAWDGRSPVQEITAPARTLLDIYFKSVVLKADYDKGRVVGVNKFAYDTRQKVLAVYDGSVFRYTTPTLTDGTPEKAPFRVSGIAITYDLSGDTNAEIKWQPKRDNDWRDEQTWDIQWDSEDKHHAMLGFDEAPQCRQFALRFTGMSDNIKVREIAVLADIPEAKVSYSGG